MTTRGVTVTRGRITVPQRGTGRVFMYNPNEIEDTKEVKWGSVDVPGASHPVYQFGAGGARLISFDLFMDGDRGRFGRKQNRPFAATSLSVDDEIRFYRSLVYPSQYGANIVDVFPYTVIFTFGEYIQGLPCIVKGPVKTKINYWTPKLAPVRAIISLQLAEITTKSQTADEILALNERTDVL